MKKELLLDSYFQTLLSDLLSGITQHTFSIEIDNLSIWLASKDISVKYDEKLKTYNVTKSQFVKWLVENFIRINRDRLNSGIKIDDKRKEIVDFFSEKEGIRIDIRTINQNELFEVYSMALEDALFVSKHPSPIHSLKVLMSKDAISELYTYKECVLYEILDYLSIETEKKIFAEGKVPNPFNFVDEIEINRDLVLGLSKKLAQDIEQARDPEYFKTTLLELCFSTCLEKGNMFHILSRNEEKLVNNIISLKKPSLEDFSRIYEENEFAIIAILLTHCIYAIDVYYDDVPNYKMFLNNFSLFNTTKEEL